MPFNPKLIESLSDLQAMAPGTAFAAMGVSIDSVDDDHAAVSLKVSDSLKQPMGIVHGGITMFLIESAASIHACWKVDLRERSPVGIEINGSHVRAATTGTLRAVASVVRRSHTFVVHDVEVTHVESGNLISKGRMTSFYLRTGTVRDS